METFFSNKKIINGFIVLLVLISVLVLVTITKKVGHNYKGGRGGDSIATISVTGTGEVTAVPDIAILSLTLSKDAKTSKEAQSLLNTEVTKVLSYISSQKIDDKDVQSQFGGITPKYDSQQIYCITYPYPQPTPKIVGYTATQSLSVKIRAVDTANEVRTGLAQVGVTDIAGPTFTIDDEKELKEEARRNAIDDARNQAEVLARDLRVRLGKVASFSENNGGYPVMYEAKMDRSTSSAGQAPAPELPKGENKIISTVTITYEIR